MSKLKKITPGNNGAVKTSIRKKFQDARKALKDSLVERDDEVDLVLTAMVAREHCLFVGNPGTAKSRLLDSLTGWVEGGVTFKYLLTKFTDPMELFGPVDLMELQKGGTARVTTGMMPEAHLIFADECFKASSAILNTLLKLLNERTFKYGQQEFECPLLACVAASNEWPDSEGGKELSAMFDRFLFRKQVRPVSRNEGRRALLKRALSNDPCEPVFQSKITPEEIDKAYKESAQLEWVPETKKALWKILEELDKEGVSPGDRRVFKSTKAARAFAYIDGADTVQPEHLEVLQHVLWDDPQEQPGKCAKVVCRVANPTATMVNEQLFMIEEIVSKGVPAEAVPKLHAIKDQLEDMKDHPLKEKAIAICIMYIKDQYDKAIGRS